MKVLAAITKGGSTLILLLIIVLLVIWFGGEQFHLDKKIRLIAVTGVLAVAIVLIVIQKVMAVRSAMLIESKLKAQAQEQVASARPDQRADVQAVQTQLDEAIQALKTSRLGKGALYKLPWYMIIGPPGSGKSTALQESGLNFPYTSQGRKGVRGVGGTRNCDWWFTDEGILLDTAGRYTTEIDDREEWIGFLNLLKQARKHKPINGAMVAVSISDLLAANEEQLEAHAKNIRNRVDELTTQLEIVFPVYLLFTKCDLLQGFVEFFEDFSKNDRAQVWGCSLPYAPSAGKPYREIFEEETNKLFRNLASQRLAALASERPPVKKQNIYLFPLQFQAAVKKMADFVEMLFRPNPFQETSYFRGFYFTSGTQEGTPIDQVIRSMSAAFGLKEEAAPPAAPVDKKSYFINHLFTKIIFPDQTLARTSAKVQKRQKIVHYGTLGLSSVGTVLIFILLVTSFFGNRGILKSAEAAATKVRQAENDLTNPAHALEALEELRLEILQLDEWDRGSPPPGMRWGLYRGNVVNPAVRQVYFGALKKILLVPSAERLYHEIDVLYVKEQSSRAEKDTLNSLLRVYRILGGEVEAAKHRDILEGVLLKNGRWTGKLEGAPAALAEKQLKFLLTQLDRKEEWTVPILHEFVKRVNQRVAMSLWVLQAYLDMVEAGVNSYPTKITGETMIKGRGRDMLDFGYSFSEVFTQKGWNQYFKAAIRSTAESLAHQFEEEKLPKTREQIDAEFLELHRDEYTRQWDEFIKVVKVRTFVSVEDAANKMKVLAGDQSPFLDLFRFVWENQRLRMSDADVPVNVDLKPLNEARNALYEFQQTVEEFVATTQTGNRVTGSIKEGKLQPLLDSFKKANRGLDTAVRTAPQAVQARLKEVLYQMIDKTREALALEAQKEADDLWAGTVARLYKEGIQGRYPFDEASAAGAAPSTMANLFNPQSGVFWNKVNDLKTLNGLNLEGKPLVAFSRDFNAAVKRAETFRQALFRKDGDRLNMPFKVTLKQRQGVTDLKFKVGKKEFNLNDRPDNRGELVWEGEVGATFQILVGEVPKWQVKGEDLKDEWAVFRLIASGNPLPSGDKTFNCSWSFNVMRFGVEQTFVGDLVLEAEERINPFQKDFFTKFSVPDKVGP
jgi:type VI secretion system IcmF/VasK family protein